MEGSICHISEEKGSFAGGEVEWWALTLSHSEPETLSQPATLSSRGRRAPGGSAMWPQNPNDTSPPNLVVPTVSTGPTRLHGP